MKRRVLIITQPGIAIAFAVLVLLFKAASDDESPPPAQAVIRSGRRPYSSSTWTLASRPMTAWKWRTISG